MAPSVRLVLSLCASSMMLDSNRSKGKRSFFIKAYVLYDGKGYGVAVLALAV